MGRPYTLADVMGKSPTNDRQNFEVKLAVSNLKRHKSDGCTHLSSDLFINAGDDCIIHVTLHFSPVLFHGTAPDEFLLSKIIPTPKVHDAKLSDRSNLRGIA